MEKRELKVGDILQINPDSSPGQHYGAMLLIVTDPKVWGAQGVLYSPVNFEATRFEGRAYLRVVFEDVEFCGNMEWMQMDNFGDLLDEKNLKDTETVTETEVDQ